MVGEVVYVVGTKEGVYENNPYKQVFCISPFNGVNGLKAECLRCDVTAIDVLPQPGTFAEISFNRYNKLIGIQETDKVSSSFVALINSVFSLSVVDEVV